MTLISAEQLSQNFANYLPVDCRFSLAEPELGEQHYGQGHIPGAHYAHLDRHLSSPITASTGRHPLPDLDTLAQQLGSWGIDENTHVVAYDDSSGFFASRLWWLLRTLGHDRVSVLDGGIQAWQASGFALSSELPISHAKPFQAIVDRSAWKELEELQACLSDASCLLIDARTRERFAGIEEPIDPVAGHIPGAVNLPITENLDDRGHFLPAAALRDHYLALIGDRLPEQVVHSCGSGVFACHGILAMEVAGLHGSKLYPGSWSEWIRDPGRPVATL